MKTKNKKQKKKAEETSKILQWYFLRPLKNLKLSYFSDERDEEMEAKAQRKKRKMEKERMRDKLALNTKRRTLRSATSVSVTVTRTREKWFKIHL